MTYPPRSGQGSKMNEAIMQKCHDECLRAYLKRAGFGSTPVGFDPTIIITIITTLLALCKKGPAELKASADNPSWQSRAVVNSVTRRVLREKHGLFAWGRFNGEAMAAAVLDVGAGADEAEIAAMCECC